MHSKNVNINHPAFQLYRAATLHKRTVCPNALVTAFHPWPPSPLVDASERLLFTVSSISAVLVFSLGISSRTSYATSDLFNMHLYAFCLLLFPLT